MDTPTEISTVVIEDPISFDAPEQLYEWGSFEWEYEHRTQQMLTAMCHILKDTLNTGDQLAGQLLLPNLPVQQKLQTQYFHFVWVNRIKQLVLLLRDVILEQQKGKVGLLEQVYERGVIEANWAQSLTALQQARQEIQQSAEKETTVEALNKKAKSWHHQTNPWAVYRAQLVLLEEQASVLATNYNAFAELKGLFVAIENTVTSNIESCNNELEHVMGKIDGLVVIQQELEKDAHFSTDLLQHIDSILATYHNYEYNLPFKEKMSELLDKYEQPYQLCFKTKGGLLQQRIVSPQKEIAQWLDAEILPLLYEIWEITENIHTGVKMIIMSIKNRITLQKQEGVDTLLKEIKDITRPLIGFKSNIEAAQKDVQDITALVNYRLDQEFKLYPIFDEKRYFLPISLQSTINQRLWKKQSNWLAVSRTWYDQVWNRVKKQYQKWSYSHHLGISEKIALCIQSRRPDTANVHYINIFQTKGYVGDSFFRGRDEQVARVATLVDRWKEGIRGSLLLTGDRFSGKTVFTEAVAQKFFGSNVARLIPNTDIEVNGRKHTLSTDLVEALEIIARHGLNKRLLVIIDNLELWWSPKHPLYKNVAGLIEHIDRFSNRLFFVVTTNVNNRNQLFEFSNLERTFQAEINLNVVTKKALHQAIWIRHAATHKQLINKKGEDLPPNVFAKTVNYIYKISRGNIGEALNIWANSMLYIDEHKVRSEVYDYLPLPNFLNDDSILVLETVLKHKRTNEYHLRQLFGPAFKTRYATVVRRLINTGILTRQLDNYIEINPSIISDLAQLLNK